MTPRDVSEALTDGRGSPLLSLDALPAGGFAEAEAPVDGVAESLILHRAADGAVRAWLNVCPHAGRRLDWAPGRFLVSKTGLLVCAVHGASFETVGGVCEAGPCRGDALRPVPVEVRGEAVWLADPSAVPGQV
ncbi:Rieske (2Fe-2S) protein [Luteimonas granuli]|uniref:Rieske 2Fe-2S domain-containing protein n=1 Tax=Luteimonas granuli TaxID=1176533 RepID=A0A518N2Z3_9GAMM|nr:Rieske 2Fe-2S domain-containing protein [Luteimonas granuli]QDW66303.1 Rieske 2Fe-2S domain-containing protein [Luteimonas granuli]